MSAPSFLRAWRRGPATGGRMGRSWPPSLRACASAHGYGYAIGSSLMCLAVIFWLTGTWPVDDAAYAPMALATLVGLLLTVRLSPGRAAAALVLLPAMVFDARFGLAALPALAYVGLVANLVRGVRGPRVVSTAAHLVLAFAAADVCARLIAPVPAWITFVAVFAVSRLALWHLAHRLDTSPTHEHAEMPELGLSLALAPIGLLPTAAGERLGDGALLLVLAAVLALLFVVREAVNLVTARSEMEAQRDRLARANTLHDDLIDLITHELRNPLTLILSYTQLTRRATLDASYDSIPTYLGHVERAGRSIQRLIDNLLQLSRLERSDALPPAEPVQVRRLIDQVIGDLLPLARQKRQNLRSETAEDLDPLLSVPMLTREALSNLVSNAIKYTPEGGDIKVWAERGQEPRTLVVGVLDTGIGLSLDDQTRLFTKFFRSSDPEVQRERGTGLGLALTHSLVTRMGGRITVESRPGHGTAFRLILPATLAA